MDKDAIYYELEEILGDVIAHETSAGEMGLSIDEAIVKIYKLFGFYEYYSDESEVDTTNLVESK